MTPSTSRNRFKPTASCLPASLHVDFAIDTFAAISFRKLLVDPVAELLQLPGEDVVVLFHSKLPF